MILSTKKKNEIAKKCEQRFNLIKDYPYVTSVPEKGKPYILKECYSEGGTPGILVELAKCKGLGKSKFADIVKEMNKERKKFAKDFANQGNYYNIVSKFAVGNDSSLKADIEKLNKIYKKIEAMEKDAYDVACKQRDRYKKASKDDQGKYGYYPSKNPASSNGQIRWICHGLILNIVFFSAHGYPCYICVDRFVTWKESKEESKKFIDEYNNLRIKFLEIFDNNPKLEPYLLLQSTPRNVTKEINSVLKRVADYKEFVEIQCKKWGHYFCKKGPQNTYWDKVKYEVAKYMSNLNWKETKSDEEIKEVLEELRKKKGNNFKEFIRVQKELSEWIKD